MNYVGLFEGISGFGLAFKRAGATIKAVCEIDKTCQSVLRRHHPEAEIISDVKEIKKESFASGTIDILAGGFPCQDLSVAGQRKGLAGERSGLWFEFIRIIGDHKPRWVVIENVPGLLSSNGGRDFAVVLRGLAECGYFVAYRVLDSQYDGVAQRRNRVFIVASLGTADCAEILFERDGSAWDSPPRREAGKRVADSLTVGANQTCGFPGDVVEQAFGLIGNGEYADRPATLRAKGGDCGGGSEHLITATVTSKWAKGTGGRAGDECQNLVVAPTLRSNGDAHSGFTTGDGLVIEPQTVAYNLTFCDANGRRADRPNGGLYVNKTERANTLTSGEQGKTLVTQAFQINASDEVRTSDIAGNAIAGAVSSKWAKGTGGEMKQQSYVTAFTTEQTPKFNEDQALTLTKQSPTGGGQVQSVLGQFGVRRLTPTECERLQGFPDGWTAFGHDGKPISDSARYRMLGNAVCVPTAEWIARRIAQVEKGER